MIIFIKNLITPIVNVSNLEIITLNNTALLTWDLATDFDVKTNGSVIFRFSNKLSGVFWENSIKLKTVASGQSTSVNLPLLTGTYFAKFVDSAGNQSMTATSVVVGQITNLIHMNPIVSILNQEPFFSGSKTNMAVVGGRLIFNKKNGVIYQSGSYEFDTFFDIGSVQNTRIIIDNDINAFNLNDFIASRTEKISTWESISNPPANVVVEAFISTTSDDPSANPTWSPWRQFTIADYTARAFKFKIEANAQNINHQVNISKLSVKFELPDRTETLRHITSGVTAKTITYTTPFVASPVVTVTPVSMSTGDYFKILNESAVKFEVSFYNSSNVAINRIFNYHSMGY